MTRNIFPTTKKVELIRKKEFAIVIFNPKYKVFVIYITTLSFNSGNKMNPSKKAQIVYLKVNKTLIEIFSKYIDFKDIFLLKLAIKFLNYTSINNHIIKLVYD